MVWKVDALLSSMSLFSEEDVFDDSFLTESDLEQMDRHNKELHEVCHQNYFI